MPNPTAAASACVALRRAHTEGQFALGYYWWNALSPSPGIKSQWGRGDGSCAVLLAQVKTHHTHRAFGHTALGTPPPLYCTSSSQSQQAHSEPFLGTVIIVIYVYGERHAPISSLCDTASKLVSPLLIACNIPAPSHIAFFSAHFFLMWGLPLLHQP